MKRHRTSAALRCTHFGTWRALAALPAMTGSVLLLVVLLGGLGRWEGPALLAWMAAGLLALTRTWERVVLRFVCRARAPMADEAAALEPIRLDVLDRCGLGPDRIDLCIADLRGRNAYAAGARSIILTRELSRDYLAGKIGRDVLAAVLCHEVGHHVTGALKVTPVVQWLTLPWRLGCRVGAKIASRFLAGQPRPLLAAVVLIALSLAIGQAVQLREWGSAAVLCGLVPAMVGSPIADAAISRASERAADSYAAQHGYAASLQQALRVLDVADANRSHGFLRSHPTPERRIRDLAIVGLAKAQS